MEQLHYCPADAHWLLPTPPARTEDASSSRTVVVGHIPCSGQWNVSKCDVSRSPHMLYNITLFLGYSDLKWGKPSPGSRCISSPGPVTIPQGEHPSQSQQEPSAGNQHPEARLARQALLPSAKSHLSACSGTWEVLAFICYWVRRYSVKRCFCGNLCLLHCEMQQMGSKCRNLSTV